MTVTLFFNAGDAITKNFKTELEFSDFMEDFKKTGFLVVNSDHQVFLFQNIKKIVIK